jgi:hypothetical protein
MNSCDSRVAARFGRVTHVDDAQPHALQPQPIEISERSHHLTDDEWALVAPLVPPAKRGGAKRTVDVREVMNGIMYILSTGCWRGLPKGPPPKSTVHDYLDI